MATKYENPPMRFPYPYATVFEATCNVLRQRGYLLNGADPAQGAIQANSTMDMLSWGENVSVRVWSDDAVTGTVVFNSALKFGIHDWGKNKKNVTNLLTALQTELDVNAAHLRVT